MTEGFRQLYLALARHESAQFQQIPGSRLRRTHCVRCGEPMRVNWSERPKLHYCEDCSPRHMSPNGDGDSRTYDYALSEPNAPGTYGQRLADGFGLGRQAR